MDIFVEKENKTITVKLETSKTLIEILKDLDISTSSVILVKNNEVCLEDELVCDSDKIKLLSVVSGG